MRPGLLRRVAVLEAVWYEGQRARLAAMSDAELEATVGPEATAWLEAYLDILDEAELDQLTLEVRPPYTSAQRRLLAAWHHGQAEAR